MNLAIETMNNHRSIRDYTDKPISPEALSAILDSAQSAPSSMNGQQTSIILVSDPKIKEALAEYAGNQAYVAKAPIFLVFVADYHKAYLASKKKGLNLIIPENVESTIVASIDAALALQNATIAAESMGLGTVCIGGIRRNPDKVIELLDLPKYVYPLVGLCIGYPTPDTIPDKKPRFPRSAFVHTNVYNKDLESDLDDYDEIIRRYMLKRSGGQSETTWSDSIAGTYQQVYYPKVSPTLKAQGFYSN